jgi:nicotinate-nucleotide adenylyltransferase
MRTVALYGGSFDPPHRGHETLVKALLELDDIDKIIIMPTFLNPFKKSFFAPADLRLKWLKEIFESEKKVEVSDFEVKQKRKVATIETLRFLSKSYEKIVLVIGADNLQGLEEWCEFKEIKNIATFIVASRNDILIPQEFRSIKVDVPISSSEFRENFDEKILVSINAEKIKKYYKENNER